MFYMVRMEKGKCNEPYLDNTQIIQLKPYSFSTGFKDCDRPMIGLKTSKLLQEQDGMATCPHYKQACDQMRGGQKKGFSKEAALSAEKDGK